MRICHCTLPYFNPRACENCTGGTTGLTYREDLTKTEPLFVYQEPSIKEVIEKFDELGRLIERITKYKESGYQGEFQSKEEKDER